MKNLTLAGLLITLLPAAAMAQSSFDGTWKFDLSSTLPTKINVWLLQNGMYRCISCVPKIDVKADGQDQPVTGQPYDTISVKILDQQTVQEIEKKNDQVVSDEKFAVSPDGNTATDEFANWKIIMARVAKGPPGSHALSGSWKPLKMESVSDKELLITYKLQGDILSMSRPTGESYAARLDGADTTYAGDPDTNYVSVKRIDQNTIEETDKHDRKVLSVARMTVSSDGKTMTIAFNDVVAGTASHYSAQKQ